MSIPRWHRDVGHGPRTVADGVRLVRRCDDGLPLFSPIASLYVTAGESRGKPGRRAPPSGRRQSCGLAELPLVRLVRRSVAPARRSVSIFFCGSVSTDSHSLSICRSQVLELLLQGVDPGLCLPWIL